jgi:type I restriction-modification system DNA methylase subunit
MMNIQQYTQALNNEFKTKIAREHAYRPALKDLFESVEEGIQAINEPKHSEGGAPDFIVLRGIIPIAFAEAKDIGVSLDRIEDNEQIKRYLQHYENFILTDYLEFRWYISGEHVETVKIGEKRGTNLHFDEDAYVKLESLLGRYLNQVSPTVDSAEVLAQKLAGLARDVSKLIELYLQDQDNNKHLQQQKLIFEQELIPSLDERQFADMYAQTLAYGLFAARVNYTGKPEEFTLQSAFWKLPNTNPFLRKLFQSFATELDPRVRRWGDVIAQLLAHTNTDEILANFGRRTAQTDPVIHFYETFLSAYDPKQREERGVYYTPEPVVSYIVRSVHLVLQQHFKRPDGLADRNTLILDPATGTGTFLYFVIQHIYEQIVGQVDQAGRWNGYVSQHLLKRIFGFELLMAPYTIAHMKMQILLKELGYDFKSEERLGIYLTNSLDPHIGAQSELKVGIQAQLSQEAGEARAIREQKPIMVVLGNPPYSGHSANENNWIDELLRTYYVVDGRPLGERNSKWLRDDYVKFIRMGQDRIQRTGYGVLAFVTNHGYLDNPTFRGMRQALMQTFSNIYILDLHGNSKKKEKTPDGAPDKNVFDIQQGVSIGIFIKDPTKAGLPAQVHRAHLWGAKRQDKYQWLESHDIDNTDWTAVQPQTPFYLFLPQDVALRDEYQAYPKITDILPTNVLGFQSHRDKFAIDFDREALHKRIEEMRDDTINDEKYRQKYQLSDTRDWQLSNARKRLRQLVNWEERLILCAYRPFDLRSCYLNEAAMDYPRRELVQHVMGRDNLCLGVGRQGKAVQETFWSLVMVSNKPLDANIYARGGGQVFPLYFYRNALYNGTQKDLHGDDVFPYDDNHRRPNLQVAFVRTLEAKLGKTFQINFSPEDIFYYAYAIFHSPSYRVRYAEFLKIDFPRLPLTNDWALFQTLSAHGHTLVQLHLMTHPALHKHGISFPQVGDDTVAKGYPKFEDDKVFINKTQYFGGVHEDEWAFSIGGYQVLDKWLKDRLKCKLSDDEITHYQRIVRAIGETMRVTDELEEIIAFPMN